MERIVFIGACFPPDILNQLIKKKELLDVPANIFGWKIVEGISQFVNKVIVINDFKCDNKNIVKTRHEVYNNIDIYVYSKINIDFLEKISKAISIYRALKLYDGDIILVYSLHTPYLLPALKYAKKKNKKVVCIVPDLPNYMFGNHRGIKKILKLIDSKIIDKAILQLDGFIILTKNMNDYLKAREDTFIVVEGIANIPNTWRKSYQQTYILYSGSVSKAYGLPEFIDAYLKSNINSELWICGKGDYVEELNEITKEYSNIKYLGLKTPEEVLNLQTNASLLINPRNAEDTYTLYSFPSKTMEYLASGTPVMMERLRGIPEEYYDYIITVEKNWTEALNNFFALDEKKRNEIGRKGKNFIMENKTIPIQGRRIVQFLEGILKNDCKNSDYN